MAKAPWTLTSEEVEAAIRDLPGCDALELAANFNCSVSEIETAMSEGSVVITPILEGYPLFASCDERY